MKFQQVLEQARSGSESAKTSVSQVAAGIKAVSTVLGAKKGDVNIDWGGGRYDKGTEYLSSLGITNYVYDPFNRSKEHNQNVLKTVKSKGGADTGTLLNVLNVIPEKYERLDTVKEMLKYIKSGGKVLIHVYERDRSGETVKTASGWQNNQPTSFYAKEIEENLPVNVSLKGKNIVLTK
jgi:hypothetical protein